MLTKLQEWDLAEAVATRRMDGVVEDLRREGVTPVPSEPPKDVRS
ncbi:hypothetical protein ABZ912_09175 [Nonomuraea angiospora]